jgi:hypothetical protein
MFKCRRLYQLSKFLCKHGFVFDGLSVFWETCTLNDRVSGIFFHSSLGIYLCLAFTSSPEPKLALGLLIVCGET